MTDLEEIDPQNILAILTPAVRDAAIKVDQNFPEYRDMSEAELRQVIQPSENADLIRGSFWIEYRKARDSGRRMFISHVYDGVMTKDGFTKFLDHPKQVAWMMKPPVSEFLMMEVENSRLRKEFARICKVPLVEDDGRTIRIKEARLALDIYKMYADRLHGAVLQRVEKKIQHIPANDISGDPEKLIAELEELRKKQADAIDVSKTDE